LSSAFINHSAVSSPGGFDNTYLTIMDLIPTFVEIGGGAVDETFDGREVLPVRGRSFWGRVRGDELPVHDEAVPILSGGQAAVVRWPWKIVGPVSGQGGSDATWMLFNLEEDPGERTDRSDQDPDIRDELVGLVPDQVGGAQ
jgi:arylsulfatase